LKEEVLTTNDKTFAGLTSKKVYYFRVKARNVANLANMFGSDSPVHLQWLGSKPTVAVQGEKNRKVLVGEEVKMEVLVKDDDKEKKPNFEDLAVTPSVKNRPPHSSFSPSGDISADVIKKDTGKATLTYTPKLEHAGKNYENICYNAVDKQGLNAKEDCSSVKVIKPNPVFVDMEAVGTKPSSAKPTPHNKYKYEVGVDCELKFTLRAKDAHEAATSKKQYKVDIESVETTISTNSKQGTRKHTEETTKNHIVSIMGASLSASDKSNSQEKVFSWKPTRGFAGFTFSTCFRVVEKFNKDFGFSQDNPGVAASSLHCVDILVRKCAACPAKGKGLSHLATVYETDWTAIWSNNPDIKNEDDLSGISTVVLGNLYAVKAGDTINSISKFFGTTEQSIMKNNPDISARYSGSTATIKKRTHEDTNSGPLLPTSWTSKKDGDIQVGTEYCIMTDIHKLSKCGKYVKAKASADDIIKQSFCGVDSNGKRRKCKKDQKCQCTGDDCKCA